MQRMFPYSCGDATNSLLHQFDGLSMNLGRNFSKNLLLFIKTHKRMASLTFKTELESLGECRIAARCECGRREYMEDRHSIIKELIEGTHYVGVFDGHGGASVAMGCADILSQNVRNLLLDKYSPSLALVTAFKDADRKDLCSWGAKLRYTGTTATVALIDFTHITICNVGDSAAFLLRDSQILPMSCSHKPSRRDEAERIKISGGFITCSSNDSTERVQGVITITRAIGDHKLRPYVCCEPEVTISPRTCSDKILIIATDGLWDVLTPKQAMMAALQLQKEYPNVGPASVADFLIKLAYDKKSNDNITVVVVLF